MSDTLSECLDLLQNAEEAKEMAEAATTVHDTLWLAQHVANKRFGAGASPEVVCKVADMILVVQEPAHTTYSFSPYVGGDLVDAPDEETT